MTVQFQFVRTTHENGRFRSFSPEALTFWQQHDSVVGAVLRPETPLTFAQILTACREYALDHIADGPQPELVPGYVAWVLVHLVGYGLAATIPAFPLPHPSGSSTERPFIRRRPKRRTPPEHYAQSSCRPCPTPATMSTWAIWPIK